jgi:predicted aldo/keto reductase-like oxidoreductase
MGVFIISPADKGGKLYDPPKKLVDLCAPLHPLVFNSLFCFARPEVHTLSLGAARPSDFDIQMQAIPLVPKIPELLPPILARLEAAKTESLPAELRDPWTLNFPEHQNAPGGLNIQVMLWLRSLAKAFDMHAYGEMRYNLIGNGGHWFPGVNAANIDSLDLAPAAKAAGIPADRLKQLLHETHTMLGKTSVKRLSQS